MIFIKKFYEKLNRKWEERNNAIVCKRKQWESLKRKIKIIFEQVKSEAQEAKFYERPLNNNFVH